MKNVLNTLFLFLFCSATHVFSQTINTELKFTHFFKERDIVYQMIPHCGYKLPNGKIAVVLRPAYTDTEDNHPAVILYTPGVEKPKVLYFEGPVTDAYLEDGELEIFATNRIIYLNAEKEGLFRRLKAEEPIHWNKYSRPLPDSKYSIVIIKYLEIPEGFKENWGIIVSDLKKDKTYEFGDVDLDHQPVGSLGTFEYSELKTFKNNQYFLRSFDRLVKLNVDGYVQGNAKKDYLWIYNFNPPDKQLYFLKSFHYDAATNSIVALTKNHLEHPNTDKFEGPCEKYHIHLINAADGKLRETKSLFPETDEFTKEKPSYTGTELSPNSVVFTDNHFYILVHTTYQPNHYYSLTNFEIMKFDYKGNIVSRHPLKNEFNKFIGKRYESGLFHLGENKFLVWIQMDNDYNINFYEVTL